MRVSRQVHVEPGIESGIEFALVLFQCPYREWILWVVHFDRVSLVLHIRRHGKQKDGVLKSNRWNTTVVAMVIDRADGVKNGTAEK